MADKKEILAAVVKENKGDFVFESLLLDPPRPNEVRASMPIFTPPFMHRTVNYLIFFSYPISHYEYSS